MVELESLRAAAAAAIAVNIRPAFSKPGEAAAGAACNDPPYP